MGPLFVMLGWLMLGGLACLAAFALSLVLAIFLPAQKALALGFLIVVAGGIGAVTVALALAPFFAGVTIRSATVLIMYFGALAAGSALSSGFAAWMFLKRSNN